MLTQAKTSEQNKQIGVNGEILRRFVIMSFI
jgi:hypothetical protein